MKRLIILLLSIVLLISGCTMQKGSEDIEDNGSNIGERVVAEIDLKNGKHVSVVFNGDVLLRVENMEVIIDSHITKELLFNKDEGLPNIEYDINQVNNNRLLAITEHKPSMNYINVSQKVFEVKEDTLEEVWKTEEIDFDILKIDNTMIEISNPLIDESIRLKLTEEESIEAQERLANTKADLKANGQSMDKLFWDEIKDNLITVITGCNWLDIDQDGMEEIVVSIYCYTVGGATPVRFREKGLMIYKVGTSIELDQILFKRDYYEDILMPYFIGEVEKPT